MSSPFSSPTITYRDAVKIANAAGRDAGNRSAHDNGRHAWAEQDWDAASEQCDAVLIRLGFGHIAGG